jgi:hypothetical protein
MQSSRHSSSQIQSSSLDAVHAKVIVLGDQSTGKSSLIANLEPPTKTNAEDRRHDGFFTLVEIPAEELESTSNPVILKVWEHSRGVSKQEEELAFRGALFCIITLDIRNPETANSALNKWADLKESLASDCFLFVIGTHLDQASHRRVDLKEVCKACAKRDAVYMEISNATLSNTALLRKLLKQRLNYMLYRKEVIAHRPFTPTALSAQDDSGAEDNADHQAHTHRRHDEQGHNAAEENKHGGHAEEPHLRRLSHTLYTAGAAGHGTHSHHAHNASSAHNSSVHGGAHAHHHAHTRSLAVPALEPNILCDSVGSILASHLGTEFWPGLEEEGEELEKIGWKIGSFIEQLSESGVTEANLTTASTALLDDAFSSQHSFHHAAPAAPSSPPRSPGRPSPHARSGAPLPTEEYVDAGYSLSDLRAAFEIMGLSLPASLETASQESSQQKAATDSASARPAKAASSATTYLRKMTVKLPDGTSADMILDLDSNIEQQIELFLLSNSLAEDDDARQKLIAIGRKVQLKYCKKEGRPSPQPMAYHTQQHAQNAHSNNAQARKDASSPSDSSASGSVVRGKPHLLHHIQGSVPFSGAAGIMTPEAGHPSAEGGRSQGGGAQGGRRVKLRIALGGGASAEVIYRSGESLQALTESLVSKHQLSRDQAQRVFEQLSQATASL